MDTKMLKNQNTALFNFEVDKSERVTVHKASMSPEGFKWKMEPFHAPLHKNRWKWTNVCKNDPNIILLSLRNFPKFYYLNDNIKKVQWSQEYNGVDSYKGFLWLQSETKDGSMNEWLEWRPNVRT
jgi:hypothetical protein